jgi:hypothetical protein
MPLHQVGQIVDRLGLSAYVVLPDGSRLRQGV